MAKKHRKSKKGKSRKGRKGGGYSTDDIIGRMGSSKKDSTFKEMVG